MPDTPREHDQTIATSPSAAAAVDTVGGVEDRTHHLARLADVVGGDHQGGAVHVGARRGGSDAVLECSTVGHDEAAAIMDRVDGVGKGQPVRTRPQRGVGSHDLRTRIHDFEG